MKEARGHVVHVKIEHNVGLLFAPGTWATCVSLCIPTAGLYLKIISLFSVKRNPILTKFSIAPHPLRSIRNLRVLLSPESTMCLATSGDLTAGPQKGNSETSTNPPCTSDRVLTPDIQEDSRYVGKLLGAVLARVGKREVNTNVPMIHPHLFITPKITTSYSHALPATRSSPSRGLLDQ